MYNRLFYYNCCRLGIVVTCAQTDSEGSVWVDAFSPLFICIYIILTHFETAE